MHRRIALALFALVIALVVLPRWAGAGEHQVRDEAHVFPPDMVNRVDRVLDQIHDQLHKDLMVETFPSIPDELRQTLERQGAQEFYNNWIITEARRLGVNGVFILITKDPPHLQVGVGKETREKAFTVADRDQLVQPLADAFRNGDFGGGLLHAAQFVRDTMAKNLGITLVPDSQPTTRASTRPGSVNPAPPAGARTTHSQALIGQRRDHPKRRAS